MPGFVWRSREKRFAGDTLISRESRLSAGSQTREVGWSANITPRSSMGCAVGGGEKYDLHHMERGDLMRI